MGRGVNPPSYHRRRVTAILNPLTGKTPAWKVERLLRSFANDRNFNLHTSYTQHENHAFSLAQSAAVDSDLLIAIGGDGTVSDVVSGALENNIPVGIVPNGSTNMLAKELAIPAKINQAIQIALGDGKISEIDTARVNGEVFLHLAGAGYDAEIMRGTPAKWKRLFRWLAYSIPAIKNLRSDAFLACLYIDGEKSIWQAKMVIFAIGGSVIHSRLQLGQDISRTDGIIDVLIFDPPTYFGIAAAGLWTMLGRPSRARWQHQFKGQCISLQTDRPIPYQADGDFRGFTPISVEVNRSKARILVPDKVKC